MAAITAMDTVTVHVCSWCKDDLITYDKDDDGNTFPQWCLECTEGRIAEREALEMEEASYKIILDSDDEKMDQGGGPGAGITHPINLKKQ